MRALIEPRAGVRHVGRSTAAINIARDSGGSHRAAAQGVSRSRSANASSSRRDLPDVDEEAAVAEYEKAFRNPALDRDRDGEQQLAGWSSYYERTGQLSRGDGSGAAIGRRLIGPRAARRWRTYSSAAPALSEADEVFTADRRRAIRPTGRRSRGSCIARRGRQETPRISRDGSRSNGDCFRMVCSRCRRPCREQPAKGVFVEEDRLFVAARPPASRRHHRRRRRMEGRKQGAVRSGDALLPPHTAHKLTAWRGDPVHGRSCANHGMTLKTHPLKGWISN